MQGHQLKFRWRQIIGSRDADAFSRMNFRWGVTGRNEDGGNNMSDRLGRGGCTSVNERAYRNAKDW